MDVQRILEELDAEIAHLQTIRASLSGLSESKNFEVKGRRGRPKGSKNAPKSVASATKAPAKKKAKRQLSPEGRKAIAEAMKRRWAERRKQTA